MAKVTLRNSFLQIYKETTDYSYQNFGRLCVQRFDESLQAIINRLCKHPLSSPREPLLKRFHRPYHSAIIMPKAEAVKARKENGSALGWT